MSDLLFDIIPAVPRENLSGLQACISKLENHLKCTNEKLGKFRKLIRSESNIKSRNTYLSKVYAMVKEQHTIQSILENYKAKQKCLETRTKQNSDEVKHQQTKNTKLFELFHNYEPMETRFENKPIKTYETTIGHERKRKIGGEQNNADDVKDVRPSQISIDNHGKTMKCLKAYVKKRIGEEERKLSESKDQKEAEQQPVDVPVQLKEEEKCEPVAEPSPEQITVNNLSEAMQCLRALQEYAMLNENFRAIGLLTETEKAFISPPDDTDFEL